MVQTVQAAQRRKLRFNSFDEILDDVRALSARPTRQLGNWSLGQVCQHLGKAMQESAGDEPMFRVPLRLRIFGWLVRSRAIKHGLPSGFQLPADGARKFVPPPVSFEEGLATLEQGMATLSQTSRRVPHPVFGTLSVDQWHQLHLRHAELHLSFIVPQ